MILRSEVGTAKMKSTEVSNPGEFWQAMGMTLFVDGGVLLQNWKELTGKPPTKFFPNGR
jgi:hypothetical protein